MNGTFSLLSQALLLIAAIPKFSVWFKPSNPFSPIHLLTIVQTPFALVFTVVVMTLLLFVCVTLDSPAVRAMRLCCIGGSQPFTVLAPTQELTQLMEFMAQSLLLLVVWSIGKIFIHE